MQEFASRKASVLGRALHQLTSLTKSHTAVRIMKLTAIILLGACLQLSARGLSQTITLSVRDASLRTVFQSIEKQTDYAFFFDEELLKKAKKITINVSNLPLLQVLELCFREQPFTYIISGNTITLVRKKEKVETIISSQTQNGFPPIDIKGRVVNSNGEPIRDATVSVQGGTKRTITNANGEFTISGVEDNAIVIISHVQFETTAISLNGNSIVNATLKLRISNLDELQVIAYGTTTRRFNTGNVTSIKASEIENQPVNNPLLALQGRVPGLFITQTNGLPGGGVTVRIQGQNSLYSGNDPLYVIDGVPYISQLLNTGNESILGTSGSQIGNYGGGNPLSYLNPSDIESIEVLKDADATAIYGSRAANGAILITTKKGKAGPAKIEINFQKGWRKVARHLDMLNSEQYLEMRREALKNDNKAIGAGDFDLNGSWDVTRYTDWQKELIGSTAQFFVGNATVSGGNTTMQYLIGTTYRRETTVFPGDFKNQNAAVHFAINGNSSNQKLSVRLTGNYLVDDNRLPNVDLTQSAVQMEPVAPALYNSDATLNWAPTASGTSTISNPLKYLYNNYNNKTKNLISNMIIGYKLLPDLQISSSFGYNNLNTKDFSPTPLSAIAPESRANTPRTAYYGDRSLTTYIIEPQLTYQKHIGKSKISILLGTTIQEEKANKVNLLGTNYSNDRVLEDIKSAATVTVSSSVLTNYRYNALFGRVNYILSDKYIVNLTGRRDGSSRFGTKSRFHNFGSVGAAWIFTGEDFMKKVSLLTFGKIRASYGTTGNDQIGEYTYMDRYVSVIGVGIAYQGMPTLVNQGVSNPYLEWEETRKFQMGIDLGFLNDRFILNATYARNRSSNQLLGYSYPNFTAANGITANFPATIQNSSLEFSLQTINIKGTSFAWTTSVNLTIPRNKLIAFPGLESSGYGGTLVIGQPVNIRKRFPFEGVDPATGVYLFLGAHGSPTTTPDFQNDQTVIQLPLIPRFYGGLSNKLSFKGIELDVLFQFVQQKGINMSYWNGTVAPGQFSAGYSNQPIEVTGRWMKPGDITSIPKYSTNRNSYILSSTYSTTDASFIRLKNFSLSYQLPESWIKKIHFQNCRLYVLGQNLWTITDYKGLDPESQSNSMLPPLRVTSVGLQITL